MLSRSNFKHPFPEPSIVDKDRMYNFIEESYMLNRSATNPDTDILIERLRRDIPDTNLTESLAGERCLNWTTPDHWNVRHGRLMNIKGDIIIDFDNHPLHLWTHSIAFKGKIKRADLIENHIYTDENRPNEFAYHYVNGYKEGIRTWGFSVPFNIVKTLTDDEYFVDIDADLDKKGTLKVIDKLIHGSIKDEIFLMGHTCHPGIVSDGIACIAVANEVYHYLKDKKLKYSYRFIYGPEYWGAAAWLEKNPKTAKNLKHGIFLDMISSHEPLGFQKTAQGNSWIDRIMLNVMKSHMDTFVHRDYRKLFGNDETFYNGPGFRIPTIGVARGMHREYHFDKDNLENISLYKMEEACWVLLRMIEVFETDFIPELKYSGPIYLSRYGLFINPYVDRAGYDALEMMQILADGKTSCFQIAEKLDIDYFFVRDFFKKLNDKNFCEMNSYKGLKENINTLA
jgi:aminopeptidase-like protein